MISIHGIESLRVYFIGYLLGWNFYITPIFPYSPSSLMQRLVSTLNTYVPLTVTDYERSLEHYP